METAIEIKNLSKTFVINKKKNIVALSNVSFELSQTGLVAVVGKTGSGKSTLLNLIGGLDRPSWGSVTYSGLNLEIASNHELDIYRREKIAFVFQEFLLMDSLNVVENVELALKFSASNPQVINEKACEALTVVGLSNALLRSPKELSSGERQRVAIARALAKNARIVLCDEPTGNLDKETAIKIIEILKKIAQDRLVIWVTHDEDLAKMYCQRMIRIDQGQLVEDVSFARSGDTDFKSYNESGAKTKHRIFPSLLSFSVGNLHKNIFFLFPLCILLIAAFTVFACLFSLSRYNYHDTYVDTLKYNDIYIIPVTEYFENAVVVNDEIVMYGSQLFYENISSADILRLQEKTSGQIPIYQSYFFNKSFQDFTDFRFVYDPDYDLNCFVALNFTEVIVVDDYTCFYQPLRYGRYPLEGNEVIIYDYMADMMLYVGAFPELDNMTDLLGETLIDKDTGQNMKIVGILKSDYLRYQYASNGSNYDYPFESRYLAMLQSIFATPDFLPQISSYTDTYSINNIVFYDSESETTYAADNKFRKIVLADLSGLDMIATNETGEYAGMLLSDRQVAAILDMDVSEINEDFFEENDSLLAYVFEYYYDYSWKKTSILGGIHGIYGIYESDFLDEDVAYYYSEYGMPIGYENGSLRKSYLSLNEDWDLNSEILTSFHLPDKPLAFFEENPDYLSYDFAEYTPFSPIIDATSRYMNSIGRTGKLVGIVAAIMVFVGICGYGCLSIARNHRKIGIIKSLGASNINLAMIFCLEIALAVILSFVVSIIPTQLILEAINRDFHSFLVFDIIFFELDAWNYLYLFGGILTTMVLSLSIPLMLLLRKSPCEIIRFGIDR